MRVLGYGFHDETEAARARERLTHLFGLGDDDARVADLADNGVVLAVRAREDNLPHVTAVLFEHGGEPLIDIDESRTGVKRVDS